MSDPGIVSGPIASPAHGPGGLFSNPALGDGRMPPNRRSKSAQRRMTTKPFVSRAQQRYAFGTGQPWAEEFAKHTDFAKLKADANPHARAGEVISGALVRGPDGHFMRAGDSSATSNPKLFGKSDAQKKQEAADKKRQAKDAAKQQAASDAATALGLSSADVANLRAAADGLGKPDGALYDAGLIGDDGATTPAGDRALAALDRGDARGYRKAVRQARQKFDKDMARAQATNAKRQASDQAKRQRTADRQAMLDQRRADAAARQAASDANRQASEQAKQDAARAKLDDKERTARDTADKVGLGSDGLDALRAVAEGGSVDPRYGDALAELGLAQLVNGGYESTSEGRRALSAVESGNMRNWQASMQSARARLTRGKAFWADLTALVYKHGKHDQSSHGRKGRAGKAGASAYASARASGASHQDARSIAKQATATERAAMRAEAAQKRTDRLTSQAAHARQVAAGSEVTPAQSARLLAKADRLEARARGEKVGPRVTAAKPKMTTVDVYHDAKTRHDTAKAELDEIQREYRSIDSLPNAEWKIADQKLRAREEAAHDVIAGSLDQMNSIFHAMSADEKAQLRQSMANRK